MPEDYVKRSDVHKAFQPKYAPAINRTFAAMIDSVPAADVVEVVRCRDCIYWEPASPTRTSGNCNRSFEITAWATDFCSYGERKDGGQDDA